MAATGQLTVAAILVAAGSGERLGADVPKAFVEVGGQTLLARAARRFVDHRDVRDVIVVAPLSHLEQAAGQVPGAAVVAGGATRPDSVRCGLAALAPDVDTVLVHDVARPFVPTAVITRVLTALAAGADAAIPVVKVLDTIKQVLDTQVVATIDREQLRAVQTPQGFRRQVLQDAHDRHPTQATDDASMVEALGYTVVTVEGADESFKITRPWDVRIAEMMASS